jgi:predicted ATPase
MNHSVFQKYRRDLSDVARRVSQARGELNAIASRKVELENSVGLAKGRLDKKKDVEKFLEEIQLEAHAKAVGHIEKLLSALVMEVIPGEKQIGLEFEIERGQPSLDIVSRVTDEISEDIFEDQGGALTNIVVLGLRMTAVIQSRMRRFLVLDEPDCWIKNERVPAFYWVLKEAARKIGMQCFAISHHDTSKFAEGISVTRIHGHPENADGVQVENNPRPYRWTDDEEGFRYIRLVNVQGYVDQTLHLYPGVNALIGDNNIGKSTFVRALRAVFYGDIRDRMIRRGQTNLMIEIGLREGFILQFVRQAKKQATWRLLAPNRAVVSDEYDTSSRSVPEWVMKDIGIGPIAGLDPHIIKQKTPIFLLDKPGSVRAAVLAIGQEATHIRSMISTYKKMCEEDSATVKNGEAEMGRILAREIRINQVLEFESQLEGLNEKLDVIEQRSVDISELERLVEKLDHALSQQTTLKKKSAVLASLPTAEALISLERKVRASKELAEIATRCVTIEKDNRLGRERLEVLKSLPSEVPQLIVSDDIIRIGKAIKDLNVYNAEVRDKLAVLAHLPIEPPKIADSSELERILADLDRTTVRIAQVRKEQQESERTIKRIENEMNSLVDEMGHACPLCGGHVDDASAFLHDHHHKAH